MAAPLVALRNLTRQYPGVRALDDVSLDIGAGDVIGLVGKNGAGKSTLIKILAGIDRQDSGDIVIAGETMAHGYAPTTAHRHGLAFMHQELANAADMTVAENVALGTPFPKRLGILVDWKALAARVGDALAGLDPTISPQSQVRDLTMVQQRMVMIARALYHHARLLVLDEPSTSLTETEIAHLHRTVRQLKADGRTVIYVSHRLREIIDITDRVVVMQDGRVTLETPTKDTSEADIVAAIAGLSRHPQPAPAKRARPIRGAAGSDVVLAVSNLSRRPVINGVSFELRAGEILGIAGLVGSGRTELVRLIAGADRPTGGEIRLNGRRLEPGSPRDAVKAGIVLLPEDRRHQGLVLGMSVRENMTLASLGHHRAGSTPFISQARERATAHGLIDRLSVKTPGTEQPVRLLSGGNQQKVVLAKWLARRHNHVLIFDEPTQGVDVHAKEEMFTQIRAAVSDRGAAIVISSDFSELVGLSDRIVVLREGSIVGELDGAALDESAIVRLVYSNDATLQTLAKEGVA
jgi:ABC-type sugar transport system ATPase subunit